MIHGSQGLWWTYALVLAAMVGSADTIVENCGNTLILRCSANEQGGTSQFASIPDWRRVTLSHVSYRLVRPGLNSELH
jgi:hypothetical protein